MEQSGQHLPQAFPSPPLSHSIADHVYKKNEPPIAILFFPSIKKTTSKKSQPDFSDLRALDPYILTSIYFLLFTIVLQIVNNPKQRCVTSRPLSGSGMLAPFSIITFDPSRLAEVLFNNRMQALEIHPSHNQYHCLLDLPTSQACLLAYLYLQRRNRSRRDSWNELRLPPLPPVDQCNISRSHCRSDSREECGKDQEDLQRTRT